MKKTVYQEPYIRVIKISGDVIATSNGMEDWGNAGIGGGSLNHAPQRLMFDEEEDFE